MLGPSDVAGVAVCTPDTGESYRDMQIQNKSK
jgi:hypothetical protein